MRLLNQLDCAPKIFHSPNFVAKIFFFIEMFPKQFQKYFFFFEIGRTHIGTAFRFLFYPRVNFMGFAIDLAKIRSGQFFRFCFINFYFPPCHILHSSTKTAAKKSRALPKRTRDFITMNTGIIYLFFIFFSCFSFSASTFCLVCLIR